MEKATFVAGCFWHLEADFSKVKGVKKTTVGYMGGKIKNPSYEQVCTNKTGYIEVVQVEYDPKKVSYEQLLDVFWNAHDPTTIDRQGPDVGTQYKSVIFSHSREQEDEARKSKEELEKSGRYAGRIVTAVEPSSTFW